jgi:UTP--glucose-1-phosphate uridylyltransferase
MIPSSSLSAVTDAAVQKMLADGADDAAIAAFGANLARHLAGGNAFLPETSLSGVGTLPRADEDEEELAETGLAHANELAIVKLNGGLGTGMGLAKAKSLLRVRGDLTFLELILRQVESLRGKTGAGFPLLLMDSFSTDGDTLAALAAREKPFANPAGIPATFRQHRVPKLLADTNLPAESPDSPDDAWCPPGHGDLYCALAATGILRKLLDNGFRYAFVSNADNLGATADPALLGRMVARRLPFLMEATRRTAADRKGGHLARDRKTGRLVLRESAQCPPEETEAFQDIARHAYFNTNNVWLDLRAVEEALGDRCFLPLPLIANRKRLRPREPDSPEVFQLENAFGAAIGLFEGAEAVEVPRSRFSPVKTTNDLLTVMSDACELDGMNRLRLAESRRGVPPRVSLDPAYFAMLDDFCERFPAGAPSLIACTSLTVEGDVTFAPGIRCEGDIVISALPGQKVRLPANALIAF